MFIQRFGYEFSFTIVAFHHAFISISAHCHFIELLDFIAVPLLFRIEKLDLFWSELWRFPSILGIGTSHKLIIFKLLKTLRIVNFKTFCSVLSSAYATLISEKIHNKAFGLTISFYSKNSSK
jgi:hypothetical protein